ncbi:unnamed protein product, partial [Didymodactylos carnosus]
VNVTQSETIFPTGISAGSTSGQKIQDGDVSDNHSTQSYINDSNQMFDYTSAFRTVVERMKSKIDKGASHLKFQEQDLRSLSETFRNYDVQNVYNYTSPHMFCAALEDDFKMVMTMLRAGFHISDDVNVCEQKDKNKDKSRF